VLVPVGGVHKLVVEAITAAGVAVALGAGIAEADDGADEISGWLGVDASSSGAAAATGAASPNDLLVTAIANFTEQCSFLVSCKPPKTPSPLTSVR